MQRSRSVMRVSGPERVLEKGINLVESPEGFPVFQSLTARELTTGKAIWIDSGNQASTYVLRNLGGPEMMERVEIGRAFTPFQHHSLVHNLEEFVDEGTELLVLPKIDLLYLDGQLSEWEAEELFHETWDKIRELEDEKNLKAAVSFEKSVFSVEMDNTVEVESTEFGARFESGREVYGNSSQTMLSYWKNRRKVVEEEVVHGKN